MSEIHPETLDLLYARTLDEPAYQAQILENLDRKAAGALKEYGKQKGSIRRVPLREHVVDAIEALPRRIGPGPGLLFPDDRGGYLNLHHWRRTEWTPAVKAADLASRTPYAMRHTFAAFAIAAGVSLFYLARIMGTSVDQIDRTYGHMLPDSEEYLRGLLDSFDSVRPLKEAESAL
jgi:integrase